MWDVMLRGRTHILEADSVAVRSIGFSCFSVYSFESKYVRKNTHHQHHHHEKIGICKKAYVLLRLLGIHVSIALDN